MIRHDSYQGLWGPIRFSVWGNKNIILLYLSCSCSIFTLGFHILQFFTYFNVCNLRCSNSGTPDSLLKLRLNFARIWLLRHGSYHRAATTGYIYPKRQSLVPPALSCSFIYYMGNSQPRAIKSILNPSTDSCKRLLASFLGWRIFNAPFLALFDLHILAGTF